MASSKALEPLFLGIDTGGTYTDAVLWSPQTGLVAKAKALTTRRDLLIGIAEAAGKVISDAGIKPARIGLVSMSTTLATNALVEGQGERSALVMIGFEEGDLNRAGLAEALGNDPLIVCPGGHNVHGTPSPLDLSALDERLPALADEAAAVAICAYFAVRNPEHEIAARDLVRETTGLPVTCSHELSTKLGGPKRALTTLLNARLVSTISRLVSATRAFLENRGIDAPLMIVRGDGALVLADVAAEKPIETILSGPAASVVGARHLTGLDVAIVSDIGGTTSDIAILQDGRPRIDPEGAKVGGYRTMVEAVAMHTFGLGGDSEISLDEDGLAPRIVLGPRRLVPLALCEQFSPDVVMPVLERQLREPNPGRQHGRFALLTGAGQRAAGLSGAEQKLLDGIGPDPAALDRLITSTTQIAVLKRLVSKGLVRISGFTPSDAAHVLNLQDNWDRNAALVGARLFARKKDGRGKDIADDAETLSRRVLDALTRRSAEIILETVFDEDGLDGAAALRHPLMQNALDGRQSMGSISINLDRPVVGLGASAGLHYSGLSAMIGNEVLIPPEADVANALGAVAGHVRVSVEAHISMPQPGRFRLAVGDIISTHPDEESALVAAEELARSRVEERAVAAGADSPAVRVSRDINSATVEGERTFVEARVIATASGRPRIAVH